MASYSTKHPTKLEPVMPLSREEITDLLPLIQHLLQDDEAGPAFYLTTPEWLAAHNYKSEPF